ncbi:MAG: tetratricopeptide repeat protein, partial [Verrucomicrobia bacterium]|nr:tetratricopeptide repeat protein [Verrucomicrobiota bacterium]
AIKIYLKVLNIADVPVLEHKKALFGLAETYYKRGSLAQSVSLLDQFLQEFPEDERRVEIIFQVGLLYREMRLYPEAITTFYRVLNSIVVTGEINLPKYLSLARRSQFEIARSHYYGEQWDQALVLLDRIELFELNPKDRESLLFYQAHATLRMGEREKGLNLVQKLLHTYPSSPLVPEMLYTKAETLTQMQQHEDAVATLMELLELSGLPDENASDEWRYWRQQAGNQFANRYYKNQDFLAALRLYQGIAVLDDRAEWQLPIIYQMGICFEKLGMFDRAVESLQFVAQGVEKLSETEGKSSDAALDQLYERAQWRLNMLNWRSGLELDRFPMLAKKTSDLESD